MMKVSGFRILTLGKPPILIFSLIMFLVCLILGHQVQSQDLIKSRHTSYLTYIYQLSNKEAKHIYSQKKWEVDTSFLHTLIDEYPTDSVYSKKLDPGHYLKVFVLKNQLQLDIASVQSFNVDVLNNSTDLQVKVYNNNGEILKDAKVKVGINNIPFDKKTQNFRLKKANKKGFLTVKYKNEVAYYNLDKRYKNGRAKRVFRKVVYGSPLKYVWRPVWFVVRIPIDGVKSLTHLYPQGVISRIWETSKRTYFDVACWFDDYYCDWYNNSYKFEQKHKGYIVFSKPKYLPSDTVKFKAFITNKNGRPLKKPVNVILQKSYREDIVLTTLEPYRPGGYEYAFSLKNDSLDLTLDQRYEVILRKKDSKEYISEYFQYEEYELTKNQLSLEGINATQYSGDTAIISITGKDENDLNLLDARLEVLVTPTEVLESFQPYVFVPDTLAYFEKPLEPVGNTEIELPSHLFPAANINYEVNVALLTSDNERLTKSEYLAYYYQLNELSFNLNNDSINIAFKSNGNKISKTAVVYTKDAFGNNIEATDLMLPTAIPLDNYAHTYVVEVDDLVKEFPLVDEPALLSFATKRTNDSLIVQTVNPRGIAFSYYLYKTNNEIQRGYAKELNIKKRTSTSQNYYLAVQYLWGGKVREENYEIALRKDLLSIKLSTPPIAYPGQKVEVGVTVTDINGKPVKNTDILVHGITKKFHFDPPQMPSLAKGKKNRTLINTFEIEQEPYHQSSKTFDYDIWNPLAGLDSIVFFQFLYPEGQLYSYDYVLSDSSTQFAPFVVWNGKVQPVSVVYVDKAPIYFGWSVNEPYSFKIDSGYHTIGIRTTERLFTMDSVYFEEGKKRILSFDQNKLPKNITSEKREVALSSSEKRNLYRYIFPYKTFSNNQFAYFSQQNRYFPVFPYSKQSSLTGPVAAGYVKYQKLDDYDLSFYHEPFFEYEPSPGLLKMRSIDSKVKYPSRAITKANERLSDVAWTKRIIDNMWGEELLNRRITSRRYDNPSSTSVGYGELQLTLNEPKEQILNTILTKLDDAEFLRVYPNIIQHFHQLDSGSYKATFFMENGQYAILDSIPVNINGLTLSAQDSLLVQEKDTFSLEVNRLMDQYFTQSYQPLYEKEKQEIGNAYRRKFRYFGDGDIVTGYVFSEEDGESLPGVTVLVKDTNYGTVTDLEGYYSIKVPDGYHDLVYSFIGFTSVEKSTTYSNSIDVSLETDVQALEEVVVVGYGVENKRSLTASVASVSYQLQGRMAGVSITNASGAPGAIPGITIRGASTLSAENKPLIVIDGVPYFGNLDDLNPNLIRETSVLKGESATAIYGARAVNGVLLITTKEGTVVNTTTNEETEGFPDALMDGVSQQNSIRNNFSDVAFWQPKIITDEDGKASFEVVIPDDITKWETFAYAMNGKKQVGQTRGEIKSYKPLSAQLSMPRFLLIGDSTNVMGKSLNYTFDSVAINTTFELNKDVLQSKEVVLNKSYIDSLMLVPQEIQDSLSLKYYLKRADGYFDGEQRSLPVYPVGVEKREGYFTSFFPEDTTVNWAFSPEKGVVKVYASSNSADIIKQKVEQLINYTYNCNEQMASKLMAHLVAKDLPASLDIKTRSDRSINQLIKKLARNQNNKGLWGWWGKGYSSMWISLHVAEAFQMASNKGFKVPIDRAILEEEAIWNLKSNKSAAHRIDWLYFSTLMALEIDRKSFLSQIDSIPKDQINARLKFELLQGLNGAEADKQWIIDSLKTTQMGTAYLSSNSRKIWNNTESVTSTLLALKVLSIDSGTHIKYKEQLQNYLLDQLMKQQYLNTYLTAEMISALSIDLKDASQLEAQLLVTTDEEIEVKSFPFEMTIDSTESIIINKSGKLPVFLNAYQTFWEKEPKKDTTSFEVETHFEYDKALLEAGSPVKLLVDVEVFKDAEYVMIEVPIPAGCSYNSKPNNLRNEVHREYFKEKVVIFCSKLEEGNYQFEVDLLPRYSGNYTLNPAKVELMYFPVLHAHEGLKRVKVGD